MDRINSIIIVLLALILIFLNISCGGSGVKEYDGWLKSIIEQGSNRGKLVVFFVYEGLDYELVGSDSLMRAELFPAIHYGYKYKYKVRGMLHPIKEKKFRGYGGTLDVIDIEYMGVNENWSPPQNKVNEDFDIDSFFSRDSS